MITTGVKREMPVYTLRSCKQRRAEVPMLVVEGVEQGLLFEGPACSSCLRLAERLRGGLGVASGKQDVAVKMGVVGHLAAC